MEKHFCSLVLLLAGLFSLSMGFSSCQGRFDSQLSKEAHDYTVKHLPKKIEEGHLLDSITYDPSTKTLNEWHTFTGNLDTPEAHEVINSGAQTLRESVLANLRADTKWQTCKEEGVTFAYHYHSANEGKEIMCIVLTDEDYR